MDTFTRRDFIRSTASTVALASAAGTATEAIAQTSGPKPVRHAVIGVGGQGLRHAKTFQSLDGCELVAVCDVDAARLDNARNELQNPDGIRFIDDFRYVIEDPDIDSVSVVTPDHWHTPVALHALKAGKHVYVEKPCCHNVREGQILLEAARKTGLCVQHGTQSRSGAGIAEAVAFMRAGNLGEVRMAKAINHQLRGAIGRAPESNPPPNVNYDLWQGPAPWSRFTRNRWHYNWHWFWDYGCGDIGNDGIHQIDVARWGLGVRYPRRISASGGHLFYNDDHETPDTQVVTFEYNKCYLIYEMRLWTDYKLEGHDNGVVFYGDKGTLEVGREGCHVTLKGEPREKIGDGQDFVGNLRNFIEAARAGDPSKLNSPIHEGVISSTLCHLGNIATRVGRHIDFDAKSMKCTGDAEATKLLAREYRAGYELPQV